MQSGTEQQRVPGPGPVAYDFKQRQRMMVALGLLLVALILVVLKDRDFWFGTTPSETEVSEQAPPTGHTTTAMTTPGPAAGTPPSTAKHGPKAEVSTPAASNGRGETGAMITTSDRAVLPPLEVEVVAGGQRRAIPAMSNAIKVEMQPEPASSDSAMALNAPPASNAAEREQLSVAASSPQVVTHKVDPNYPLLAREMKVEGSVILQALIGKDGLIQDLHVLRGPTILSEAAREAVKQWRFKPYYKDGQPVETQCNVTVNFTISTH